MSSYNSCLSSKAFLSKFPYIRLTKMISGISNPQLKNISHKYSVLQLYNYKDSRNFIKIGFCARGDELGEESLSK
jgi:predicted transcriptional regulator